MIRSIAPYIILNGNGKEAVQFYENTLDAKILHYATFGDIPGSPEFHIPDNAKDWVMHAHLKVGDTDLMFSDTFPGPDQSPYQIGSLVTISITVSTPEKAKEVFGKLQDNGQVLMPLQETFWSPSYGQVTDKFGVTWHVSTEGREN